MAITHKALPLNGSANLNFNVVGGTSAPTKPRDNTIWVNTSTPISKWSLDKQEPTSPIDGQIWMRTFNSGGAVSFNALKKNSIDVHIYQVYQWINSEWIPRNAYIYNNGMFTQFSKNIMPAALSVTNQFYHNGGHFTFDENGNPTGFVPDENRYSNPTTNSVSIPVGTKFSIDRIWFSTGGISWATAEVVIYVNGVEILNTIYYGYPTVISENATEYTSTTASDTIKIQLCGKSSAVNSTSAPLVTLDVNYSIEFAED